MGGARCVWDDYLALTATGFYGDMMCVNDIGMYVHKPFQHWLSLHGAHLEQWRTLKKNHGETVNCLFHCNQMEGRHINWHLYNAMPYSGLFAMQIGICLGYTQIVLCGVPQDQSGRFFDPPWITGQTHGTDKTMQRVLRQFVAGNAAVRECVRSMSGLTKELLGGEFNEAIDGNLRDVHADNAGEDNRSVVGNL